MNAPQRQTGELAAVPTRQEQGYQGVVANWRGVIAARGISAAQLTYWEDTLQRVSESPEWRKHVEVNVSEARFLRSSDFRAYLEEQNKILRVVLGDLGLAK